MVNRQEQMGNGQFINWLAIKKENSKYIKDLFVLHANNLTDWKIE